MALEVNKFTLAGNDIHVVDQYARDKIEEIITSEVTKTYVDDADTDLQNQINALPTKTYVDDADAGLQNQINGKQDTITGAASTVTSTDLTAARALYSNANGKIAASTVTSTELGRLSGVTSAIQTQIDGKQATITGAASTVTSNNLTASRALGTNGSGKIAVSSVTTTELDCLQGVTSAIQTQLNGKQATITGAATTVTSNNLTASRALGTNGSGKIAVSSTTTTELDYLHGATSSIQNQLNNKVEMSVFNNQYETVVTDQIDLFMNNISSLKLMYLRDNFKVNMALGWTQLTQNGTNLKLSEKYRPITEQYITQYLPGGVGATIRIKTDGSVLIWLTSAYQSTYTVRINLLYI